MFRWILVLTLLASFRPQALIAQGKTCRVAVLAPLYLDSAFDASGNYRLGKQYPSYAVSGMDFAEGARLALDTLMAQGSKIQYNLYDTRSVQQDVAHLVSGRMLDSVQLIIGSVTGADYQVLASFAKAKNIPFVSATYPNEGGINANPFVVILSPTIFTHCQAIYHYVRQNHPTHTILYVRKPGAMEDRLEGYFKQLNQGPGGTPLLPIQTIIATDTVAAPQLQQYMDSNRYTVVVCGSLDEAFGTSLVRACGTLTASYPMTLIGMPTWEGNRALQSPDLRQVPYMITTSFIPPQMDSLLPAQGMPQRFINQARTRPGDMAFRGYESTYLFISLLLRYQGTLMSHLEEGLYQTYTPFDIKPVFLNPASQVPDYFENKHIYILRIQNGIASRMQ